MIDERQAGSDGRRDRAGRTAGAGASVWSVLGVLFVLVVAAGGELRGVYDAPRAQAAQVVEPRLVGGDEIVGALPPVRMRRLPAIAAAAPRPLSRTRDPRQGGLPMPRAPDRSA